MKLPRTIAGFLSLAAIAVFLSASAAHHAPQTPEPASSNGIVLSIDPANCALHYTVDSTLHTVHGTFALKRGTMRLDPATGKAGGEIVADATSGDSGNAGRDKKMHKDVLESNRYREIVFHPDRVEGNVALQGASTVRVHGVFALHGSEHELVIPVHAEMQGDHWKGTASFSVPYVEWGLKNPSNFLLKVNHAVEIELQMAGNIQATQPSADR